jgi:hypothetical protein
MYVLGSLALGLIACAWKFRRSGILPDRDQCSAKHYQEEAMLYGATHGNWHSPCPYAKRAVITSPIDIVQVPVNKRICGRLSACSAHG